MSNKEWIAASIVLVMAFVFFLAAVYVRDKDNTNDATEALVKSTVSLYEHMSKICAHPVGLNITTGSESTATLTCSEILTKVDLKVK